jgi:protein tyrosine phosphatase
MIEIIKDRIQLGSKADYYKISELKNNWSYVHIGTELFEKNNTTKTNMDYYISGNHFYLNWKDLPELNEFNVETLIKLFNFLDLNINSTTFIHCDYGQSRSPAITMAYLSKRTDIIPKTFYKAVMAFKEIYPDYFVTGGITLFLKKEWVNIN